MMNNKPMQSLAPNSNPYQPFDNMNNNGGYFNQTPQSFVPNTSPQPPIQGQNHGFLNPNANEEPDDSVRNQMMYATNFFNFHDPLNKNSDDQ